MSQIKFILDLK